MLDDAVDNFVADETAGGDDIARLTAEIRIRRDLTAKHFAGGDARNLALKPIENQTSLGSFTRTGGAEEQNDQTSLIIGKQALSCNGAGGSGPTGPLRTTSGN